MLKQLPIAIALLFATQARADEQPFCAQRPGQTTPPCITPKGRVLLELGLVDWSLQSDSSQRSDTIALGQIQLRYGLGGGTEFQLGLNPYTHQRSRDRASSQITQAQGFGDITLGIEHGLTQGKLASSINIYARLPSGKSPIGAGDWSVGAKLPVAWQPHDGLEFDLTPELDAAVNHSGSGRHLAYGTAVGMPFALSKRLQLGLDLSVLHDDDPSGAITTGRAGASLAYRLSSNAQLDLGGTKGLDPNSPNVELYTGVALRF